MKKIYAFGNSLTGGNPGESYLKIFNRTTASHKLINHGIGGDTLIGIVSRLKKLIRKQYPKAVLIEAGINDILIPYFEILGGAWYKLSQRLKKRGSIPSGDINSFYKIYSDANEFGIQNHVETIIITTITCIGEYLNGELNILRNQYNEKILKLAKRYPIKIVDIGNVFSSYLTKRKKISSYLMPEYIKIYSDSLFTVLNYFSRRLSQIRGLYLTIDGVHLNDVGAKIYAKELMKVIEENAPNFV